MLITPAWPAQTHFDPLAQVKAAYRALVLETHPDKVQARGASPEELEAATAHFVEIQAALELLTERHAVRDAEAEAAS